MLTKASAELTLFDILSRLTFAKAVKLLGADGSRLIMAGGKHDIDIASQVEFDQQKYCLTMNGSAVTLALSPSARDRLEWRCDTCDAPCEHAGAAFSLILEEKLALGLAGAPSARAPVESLADDALVAQAIAERQERARTEKMRVTSLQPQEIWTDYTLINAASGKSYRNGAGQMAGEFKARLDECLERDEHGRPRLTVTLPNEAALEKLAHSLAALLG